MSLCRRAVNSMAWQALRIAAVISPEPREGADVTAHALYSLAMKSGLTAGKRRCVRPCRRHQGNTSNSFD